MLIEVVDILSEFQEDLGGEWSKYKAKADLGGIWMVNKAGHERAVLRKMQV